MSIFFFAGCGLCILYCALYGIYSIADRNISQGISLFVMTALAAGTAVLLMFAA